MLNDDCDHEMSRLSACLTPRVLQYVCRDFIAILLRDNEGDGVVVRPWCGWS